MFTGVINELYYSKLFGGKITIQPPGSAGCYDPLEQYGYINAEKDGVKKRVLISDILIQQGFDGMDDMVRYMRDNWHGLDYENRVVDPKAPVSYFEKRRQYWLSL